MPTPRHLGRAPIREAVIEIQVPPLDGDGALAALRELAETLSDYPTVQPEFELRGQLSVGVEGEVGANHEARRSGYRVISRDDTQIVQLRTNGISISRLEPYVSWDQLRDEARVRWTEYRERLGIERAVRFGLRYINRVRIPYPVADLHDFFLGLPDPPGAWPNVVTSFLYRTSLHDAESGHSVTVTHALTDDVDEDRIGVIFDIDAYVGGSLGVSDEVVWGTFDHLRDLKNRVFFAGMTEKALSLFT